ncbi:MAG: STAS/SEC14 domain-containing protein [Thermoanaerobaculia bacterium]|nr:STAS/SEC14 domain-containing protein [Thermoanaerobaculia bacterium]
MIEPLASGDSRVLAFCLSGTLTDADYKVFVPAVEDELEKAAGPAKMLVILKDFHGWTPKAVWDDTVFATQHLHDLQRIAIVGESRWQRWMATVCRPFTRAKVRYFEADEEQSAWEWVREG